MTQNDHQQLAVIRQTLGSEGYLPQRTNKTEFTKTFEEDQEGSTSPPLKAIERYDFGRRR